MARLKILVGEVFHRFIVEQAVDGAGAAGGLRLVSLTNKGQPPFRGEHGKAHVGGHRHRHNQGKPDIVIPQQQPDDHADFQQSGQDIEHHEAQQKTDAIGAPLDIPGQAAGATIEMKIQIQGVQVPEHLQANPAHGALGDAAE